MNNTSAPLVLKKLQIRRMPGLEAGFALADLSPGVNVIYGPNGVGKSRTALALNLALWPSEMDDARRDALAAWFDIGADAWAVEIDAGEVRHQQNGASVVGPILPGIENRDRYNLALHDLLADRGEDFAAAIARESAGGYDLSAAAASLGIDRRPSGRACKETELFLQSKRQVQERKAKLAALREREEQLADLLRERDAAQRSALRISRLQAALNLADALRGQALAEERLQRFAPAIAKLTGREFDQVQQFRADIAGKEQLLVRARQERERAVAELVDARFDQHPPDETVVATISALGRELAAIHNRISAAEQEVSAAFARRASAAAAIGPAVNEQKLEQLDLKGIGELAAFARESEKVRADLIASESLRRWLGAALPLESDSARSDGSDPADRLSEGLRLLAQWLRQSAPTVGTAVAQPQWPMLLAAGLISLLALLLAWRWNGAASILALVGPLLYFAWKRPCQSSEPVADARPIFQQQYESLHLETPARWSVEEVERASRLLFDRLAAAKLQQERANRLADQQPLIDALTRRATTLKARQEEIAGRVGLSPSIDESVLYALVESILRWKQAAGDVAAANARADRSREQYAQTFASAANLLRPLGYKVEEPAAIDASCDDLRRRCEQHRAAAALVVQLDARIVELTREISAMSVRAEAVFTSVGLVAGDDATLQQWLATRQEFEQARSALDIANARARELGADLRDERELVGRPREELELLLVECREQAQSLQALTEKIAGIRKEIDLAQNASDLEEAQSQQREAAAALATSRAADIDLAAGWVLLEHLRKVSRERHQSAVFHRARELFARITRGRYRLECDEGQAAAQFRCIDTITGLGQSLDELSSGTRVQLLLAVRVAFVEQQEQGPRLPLILDETLANSDESRARQILDAVIEICRTGRQIFYFTAQPDEVGKWREALDSHRGDGSLRHRLIDLAAVRGLAESERTPVRQIVTAPATLVPPPAGLTRDEYARLLEAPGIDPYWPTAGGVHLCHLLDDLPALHKLLSMGIQTWGQWRTMNEVGGLGIAEAGPIFSQARARAELLESLSRLWRIGRGKPVDRAAIIASDTVSKAFLDAVCNLAAAESGDARSLIAGLEEGAVRKFRSSSTEKLSNWLEDNGYLDSNPPLTPAEMRIRALAIAGKDLESGLITAGQIDEYLNTWFVAGSSELTHLSDNGSAAPVPQNVPADA